MTITRHDPTSILSNAVQHGDTVYLAGVVAKNLDQDVKGQTKQVLDDIDRCEPKYIVEVTRGLQTILRSPRVVYLLLGDRNWIEQAFEVCHNNMKGIHVGHVGFDNSLYGHADGLATESRGEFSDAVRELRRVLKPGGGVYFDNVSLMGSVAFDVSDTLNLYATYAEGWKAGGVNRSPAAANQVLPYDDEFSTTYELGLKSNFADGRVSLNGAVFYIDLQDQQQALIVVWANHHKTFSSFFFRRTVAEWCR